MGAADCFTQASIRGSTEEVFTAVKLFQKYATENQKIYDQEGKGIYLLDFALTGAQDHFRETDIEQLTDEEIVKFIKKNKNEVDISARGPYGTFWELGEFRLFYELAEMIPHAEIWGKLEGEGTFGSERIGFVLKDGLMACKYWSEKEVEEDEDDDAPEWDYVSIYDPIAKKAPRASIRPWYTYGRRWFRRWPWPLL